MQWGCSRPMLFPLAVAVVPAIQVTLDPVEVSAALGAPEVMLATALTVTAERHQQAPRHRQ